MFGRWERGRSDTTTPLAAKKEVARALADSGHSYKSCTPVMGSCDHWWQFLLCPGSLKVWNEYEI